MKRKRAEADEKKNSEDHEKGKDNNSRNANDAA
jgi:hypothetical protein